MFLPYKNCYLLSSKKFEISVSFGNMLKGVDSFFLVRSKYSIFDSAFNNNNFQMRKTASVNLSTHTFSGQFSRTVYILSTFSLCGKTIGRMSNRFDSKETTSYLAPDFDNFVSCIYEMTLCSGNYSENTLASKVYCMS